MRGKIFEYGNAQLFLDKDFIKMCENLKISVSDTARKIYISAINLLKDTAQKIFGLMCRDIRYVVADFALDKSCIPPDKRELIEKMVDTIEKNFQISGDILYFGIIRRFLPLGDIRDDYAVNVKLSIKVIDYDIVFYGIFTINEVIVESGHIRKKEIEIDKKITYNVYISHPIFGSYYYCYVSNDLSYGGVITCCYYRGTMSPKDLFDNLLKALSLFL